MAMLKESASGKGNLVNRLPEEWEDLSSHPMVAGGLDSDRIPENERDWDCFLGCLAGT